MTRRATSYEFRSRLVSIGLGAPFDAGTETLRKSDVVAGDSTIAIERVERFKHGTRLSAWTPVAEAKKPCGLRVPSVPSNPLPAPVRRQGCRGADFSPLRQHRIRPRRGADGLRGPQGDSDGVESGLSQGLPRSARGVQAAIV